MAGYRDGDFVVTAGSLLAGPIKPGDVIVFRQPDYGIMIKQVERLEGDGLFVVGTHERSADSREFGAISRRRHRQGDLAHKAIKNGAA